MKTTAATVVIFPRKVAAPVVPKSAWLPAPPKTAPMSAPFPVCKRTIKISAILTITCMVTINAVIISIT